MTLRPLAAATLLPLLAGTAFAQDVLVLGEVHDNPAHHEVQAGWVARVRPAALVFEMLTPQQASGAQGVAREDAGALARALRWDGRGWPDFATYHPIIEAAPEAAIRGAGLPRAEVRRAMTEGAAAVFGHEAERYLIPLTATERRRLAQEQQAAHCDALPEDLLPGMVEAQRLRDAAFARAVLQALDETGGPVALITGTGHAREDHGVPAVLARVRPGLDVLSLGQFEETAPENAPFDVVSVSPAADRPDPCLAFR